MVTIIMRFTALQLKKNEERRLLAGHLWVYSNEVDTKATPLTQFTAGQLVQIQAYNGKNLGIGYVNPHTLLCARLLSRIPNTHIDQAFFAGRIQQALAMRQDFFSKPFYRLIFGESDLLPGLVVDRYGDILVVQITTAGMEQQKNHIIAALQETLQPNGILLRNDSSQRELEGLNKYSEVAAGDISEMIELEENDVKFVTSIKSGQKTGWFYDHRENRARMKSLVSGKRVLDLFSYIGGWGIQAACAGAAEVVCVDSSANALEILRQNAKLNNVAEKVQTLCDDAFDQLKVLQTKSEKFDVVILDPPAFIKKRKDLAVGTQAYQRLNELALSLVKSNGILVSASCSLHLTQEMLLDVVRRAGVKQQRQLQLFYQGRQGADHPIHPAIPETAYLKALFFRC